MKIIKDIQHRSLSVIANCEYNEAGSKGREKEDEAGLIEDANKIRRIIK